jgi:RNase P subunit RPR2
MKILLLDIETAPNVAHVWGIWQQNVGINQLLASGYVLCWAAKWLGSGDVFFDSVYQSKPVKMLKRIHKLIDEADVVVHYNGKSFDMPTLNKEFITLGMLPPSPYKQIDLCVTAKHEFRFPSNKLEYIAKALGLGQKIKHEGHELWIGCMNGDKDCWKRMEDYNRQDVVLLERLYEKMRPWVRSHPNFGVYTEAGTMVCPSCGSGKLQKRGFARTQVNKYVRMQCMDCGSWSREPYSEFKKEDRETMARPVPQN